MDQNNPIQPQIAHVGIVGAGAMGRGIAQICAQAGLTVRLFDSRTEATAAARQQVIEIWRTLATKGRMTDGEVDAAQSRIHVCTALDDMAPCDLVIEAIVEQIGAKRELVAQLDTIVTPQTIIASNSSSLSITAIAAGSKRPERVAGFHFFNPVPLMKVVEVIDGIATDPATGDSLMELSRRLGHTPVRCKDMPGFVVNHAGRGMNIEGLKIAQEGVASFADIDDIMREQAGFRMGPFELLDLTGLDVSHPVMESIYRQFYDEARFRPSPITAVRAVGGLLGRKTGRGFYHYKQGKKDKPDSPPSPSARPESVWVSAAHPRGHAMVIALLESMGVKPELATKPSAQALIIVTPIGLDATTCAIEENLDPARVVAIDTFVPFDASKRRTLMTTPATSAVALENAHGLFAGDGAPVSIIGDSAGFVAQRIICAIVNIACDIAQQRIAAPDDIDTAVRLGLGYPEGPLAMGDTVGNTLVLEALRNMERLTGDPRYRPSPWLWRRAGLGLSLRQEESRST